MDSIRSRRLDTPIGQLTLFSVDDGLIYIAFAGEDGPEVTRLGDAATDDPGSAPQAARQLSEFFAGSRRTFDVPVAVTGDTFTRRAQRAMAEIPYGETLTYAELARAAGNDQAIRAAGSACARNPLPILWACHRVVRSDGTRGGYRGGPQAKNWLLNFEAGNVDGAAEV